MYMNKIFITVPSYEDPFLYRTLDEAVTRANNPERLVFAIALQYKQVPVPDLSRFTGENFRYITYDADNRPGITRVRHDLAALHAGEDFFFMIDSHMHFDYGWDDRIIEEYLGLQNLYGDKVIWSQPIPGALGQGTDNVVDTRPGFRKNLNVTEKLGPDESWDWLFVPYGRERIIKNPDKYMESSLVSSHFFFTSSKFLDEVGIADIPQLYEEEPFLFYSLAMSGWRLFKIAVKNFVAHDNDEYNKILYKGELTPQNYIYVKKFGPKKEVYEKVIAIDMALIFNEGPAKLKNAVMEPIDFYERYGLRDQYLVLRDNYLNRYNELMEIANKAIDK